MTPLKKPVKRRCHSVVPWGVNPEIVVTLYPGGIIGLRESGRRREVQLGIGQLYVDAIMAEAKAKKRKRCKR